MMEGNGEFFKYKIFFIETLKRLENDRKEDRDRNEREHNEIMKKLTEMEGIIITTEAKNRADIRNKQLQWGSVGGAIIIGAKEFIQWALTRGAG